jgi:hypothetical protein
MGTDLWRADGRTDGRTDMMQVIVAFRNFAKTPKMTTSVQGIESLLRSLVLIMHEVFLHS